MKQIKEIHQSLRESMHGGRQKSWSTWQLANTISYLLLLYIGSDPCFKIGIVSICCIGISEWHWLYIGIAPWIRIVSTGALSFQNGIDGLVAGKFEPMSWESVTGWASLGGALLGTKRTLAEGKLPEIAEKVGLTTLPPILIDIIFGF